MAESSAPARDDNRFARVPIDLYTSGVSPRGLTLYGWLSARYGGYKDGIYPAVPTLAGELGWPDKAVQKALRELEAAGWLTIEPRTKQTRNGKTVADSNLYILTRTAKEAARLHARRAAVKPQVAEKPDVKPQVEGGVKNDTTGGVKNDTRVVSKMTPYIAIEEPARPDPATAFLTEAIPPRSTYADAPVDRADSSREEHQAVDQIVDDGSSSPQGESQNPAPIGSGHPPGCQCFDCLWVAAVELTGEAGIR